MRKCAIPLIFAFLLLKTGVSISQEYTAINVKGTGAIIEEDRANARDMAIKDAKRKAVEQVAGTFVTSETYIKNFMMVEDNILTQSEGYVRNYEILSEGEADRYTYEVEIKAEVSQGSIVEDLASIDGIIFSVGKPRIMVLMKERNMTERERASIDLNTSEIAIMNAFLDKSEKFNFVDQETAKRGLNASKVRSARTGAREAAMAIARANTADMIIVGEAYSQSASQVELAGMKSCQANVGAKVIWTDTGEIIASGSERAATAHIDEITGGTIAIEKASTKLAENLMGTMLRYFVLMLSSGSSAQLIVHGVDSYAELLNFETTLKLYVRGLEELEQRSFDSGVAIYDITIETDTRQMARELVSKDLGKYKVKILGVSKNKLEISIQGD